jgi:cobalt transporter subunit CbtA
MFRRIFLSAILAGCAAGLLLTLVQQFTTVPLILAAETYEDAGATGQEGGHGHGAAAHRHDETAWAPDEGIERILFTGLANVVVAVGYGLLLVACLALSGRAVDGREGLLWGLAGFAVFSLAPGLGLPPELPGSMAAALEARQLWWLLAAGATALGLWLLVFAPARWLKALGFVALALPHLVGAPHPESYGGPVPPEMAGHFAAASLATMAMFWALLGWLAGSLYARAGDRAGRTELARSPA